MSSPEEQIKADLQIEKEQFGQLPDGRAVTLYRLSNPSGMFVEILDYGGIIVRLFVPDRNGNLDDVVLGFDSLDGYLKPHPKFGAFCGRIAGRVAKGRFSIDGKEYQTPFVDKMVLPIIKDELSMIASLRTGKIDVCRTTVKY
jgi:aldose 1-epimerase